MRSKADIEQQLRGKLQEHREILFAYLFGSFVEDDRFRDVDVAVYLEPEAYAGNELYGIRFGNELEEVVQMPVDAVVLNAAPDHFIYEASKGKLLLDRDEDWRVEFLIQAWKRYFEIRPKRREYLRQLAS